MGEEKKPPVDKPRKPPPAKPEYREFEEAPGETIEIIVPLERS